MSWAFLDGLAQCRPETDDEPDPNLFIEDDEFSPESEDERPVSWRRRWGAVAGWAVAASLAVLLTWTRSDSDQEVASSLEASVESVMAATENPVIEVSPPWSFEAAETGPLRLPDGSLADLNAGARIEVAFTAARRDVRLLAGEAHFTVVKDARRPFIVEAAGMRIRAVGTAFNVRLSAAQVEVLVTHGLVAVDAHDMPTQPDADPLAVSQGALLSVGERAQVNLAGAIPETVVEVLPEVLVAEALAWQPPTIRFENAPLEEVIGLFNGANDRQLRIADPKLAALRIEGVFRRDNVDAFVRLLEAGFGVAARENTLGVTELRAAR